MHKHLRRLEGVWIDQPIYFITTCTKDRHRILARIEVAKILIAEWLRARDQHGWTVGRYVIMPDHVHFFCRAELDAKTLPEFIGAWKSWAGRQINKLLGPASTTPATTATALWQAEFFDHVLRSSESYSGKWNYVFDNPVRTGLVNRAEDWPFAGEIETLTQ
jgi:REP element-mobilizing transposase RayT